jgi:hypothetical protein
VVDVVSIGEVWVDCVGGDDAASVLVSIVRVGGLGECVLTGLPCLSVG